MSVEFRRIQPAAARHALSNDASIGGLEFRPKSSRGCSVFNGRFVSRRSQDWAGLVLRPRPVTRTRRIWGGTSANLQARHPRQRWPGQPLSVPRSWN